MKKWMLLIAAAGLGVAGAANAATPEEQLAQKSGCFTCHSVDKKVIGPPYKEVAAKYKGDASAEAKLIDKVKKGGSGVWGSMAMPPNSPLVSDADIKTLVHWVLSLH